MGHPYQLIEPTTSPGEPPSLSDHAGAAPLIEVRDLGIWYRRLAKGRLSLKRALLTGSFRGPRDRFWALRGINLTAYEGQALGIVGPNGAGKSTLCLVLSGILEPDEGKARIRGKVSALLSLGAGFHPELSGRANILLAAAFLGIPRRKIEQQLDEIIDFADLGDFIEEPVRTYSSGMRARLAFAVAATIEPEILILDEALSVGDLAFRAKSQQRIEEMMRDSRLIIIVSHSNAFLRHVCTHCLWLDHGQPMMFGAVDEVLDAYEAAVSATMPIPLSSVILSGLEG